MRFIIIVVTILHLIFDSTLAGWPTSPDSSIFIGWGSWKTAVSDAQGGVYVVHNDYFARCSRINHEGQFVWRNVYLDHAYTEAHHHSAALTSDSSLLISYQDVLFSVNPDLGDAHIRVQKISPEGDKLWGEGVVVTPDNASGSFDSHAALVRSRVIADNDGGAYVVFTDMRNDPSGEVPEMYMQRISSEGEILWDSLGVFIDDRNQDFKYLKLTSGGDVLLVYKRQNLNFVTHNLVQLIDENGVLLLADEPYDFNRSPLARFSLDSRDMLFYTDYREKIFQMDLDFQQVWTDEGLTFSDSLEFVWGLIPDANGGAIVHYTKDEESGRQFTQWVAEDGTLKFDSSGVYSNTMDFGTANLTMSDTNSCIINYNSRRSHQAQRIDMDGNLLWETPTDLCTMDFVSAFQSWAISDGGGGIIFVYDDDGKTYATQVGANGNIGSITSIRNSRVEPQLPPSFEINSFYPNPFNSSATILLKLNISGIIYIDIHDLKGRAVSSQQYHLTQGVHKIPISMHSTNLASGVYLLSIRDDKQPNTKKMLKAMYLK